MSDNDDDDCFYVSTAEWSEDSRRLLDESRRNFFGDVDTSRLESPRRENNSSTPKISRTNKRHNSRSNNNDNNNTNTGSDSSAETSFERLKRKSHKLYDWNADEANVAYQKRWQQRIKRFKKYHNVSSFVDDATHMDDDNLPDLIVEVEDNNKSRVEEDTSWFGEAVEMLSDYFSAHDEAEEK